ncbi:sugar phosphate isomerase/epimerase family protein [Lysinibacillus sp. 3P01SB]|uniref:sugar phosphate isomerase/epimerase family protein n=1 Tax=Lysinibacillus sp. 3P01SB TaxID=3132284 RepID=UPI0039A50D3F
MKICYSDLVLITNEIVENVKKLIQHGADVVELLMDGDKWDEMEALFPALTEQLLALDVAYTVHPPAWDINLTSENKAIREASFLEYKKAIEFAGRIQAYHVVIHPGFCFAPPFDKELGKRRAKMYIQQLCEIAKPLNVTLAIENVGYNGTSLFTQEEYEHFLGDVDSSAKYLLDIGHANLNGWDIAAVIYHVKDRLAGLHVHDNDGHGDQHLPIGEGTVEWASIFEVLRTEQIVCELVLEYAPGTDLSLLQKGKERLVNELSTTQKAGHISEYGAV